MTIHPSQSEIKVIDIFCVLIIFLVIFYIRRVTDPDPTRIIKSPDKSE